MKLHDIIELRESLKDAYPLDTINKELDSIIENLSNLQSKYNEEKYKNKCKKTHHS